MMVMVIAQDVEAESVGPFVTDSTTLIIHAPLVSPAEAIQSW